MFEKGSLFDKLVTYAMNGVGLVLLVFGSAEIQTFVPAEVIAYVLAIANTVKEVLTKGPASVIKP